MKQFFLNIIALLIISTLALTACGGSDTKSENTQSQETQTSEAQTETEAIRHIIGEWQCVGLDFGDGKVLDADTLLSDYGIDLDNYAIFGAEEDGSCELVLTTIYSNNGTSDAVDDHYRMTWSGTDEAYSFTPNFESDTQMQVSGCMDEEGHFVLVFGTEGDCVKYHFQPR